MRTHVLVAVGTLIALAACDCSKKTAGEATTPATGTSASTTTKDDGFTTGTVTTIYVDDGCPFLIITEKSQGPEGTVTGPNAPELLLPIALDDHYLKSGLHLRFKYRTSRAPGGSCTKGQPAILEEITVL